MNLKWRKHRDSLSPGFTLLEVMVSISIISIVLIAVYRIQSQTLLMNHTVRFNTTAPMLAKAKLSEIVLEPLEDLSDDNGDFGEDFPGYTWKVSVQDMEFEDNKILSGSIKQIEIMVAFNKDEMTYELKTHRFFQKDS